MTGQLRLSGGRKLQSPIGQGTRPTSARVREAAMNLLRDKLFDCHWLDLFSGSGIMGCEALQKGAARVIAVEKDPKTAQICKSNLIKTSSGLSNQCCIEVLIHEVISLLKKDCRKIEWQNASKFPDPRFDLVYLDPPYSSKLYPVVLKSLLNGNWLKHDSLVICEHSSRIGLEVNAPWIVKDQRLYGNSSLLMLSPPKNLLVDTDSMH